MTKVKIDENISFGKAIAFACAGLAEKIMISFVLGHLFLHETVKAGKLQLPAKSG